MALPKPPAVSADELFGQPAKVSSPAQTISNRRIPDISDDELVAAFKDKPLYVLDRVNWNRPKSPYRQRLENLIAKDPSLQKILDHVLPVYPQATPQPKPQAAPAVAPGVPPPVTAAQIVKPAAQPAPGNNITAKNAPKIETWMNGLKDHIFKSFAQPVVKDTAKRDVRTSRLFTQNLLSSLSLYRGGLAGFYLSEGSKELIFSALGPIGDAFRSLYLKDVQRKMSWMKHPLNPDAIYYYLQSLPNQMAFKLMYLPTKATFGILARGGAPLISKVHYHESGQTKQSYVFTPLLKATQFSNKLADKLDKLSGVVTDDIDKYWGEKSRYKQYIEGVNQKFGDVLKDFKNAKASGNKTLIKTSRNNIKDQLNLHDGKFGQAVFKNGLKNLSRRLRRSSEDPVVGLFALITGTLIDIFVGLAANFARAIANKIINVIPGLNTLRAQMIEYFTSNRVLTSLQMSGTTVSTFLKGTFSLTTASSVYGGASIGGWIANALGLPTLPAQIIGGGIGATFGSIYTTSLKMLNPSLGYFNPQGTGWIQKYDEFITTGNQQAIADLYLKGFKPGPFSRFASFLYNRWWLRLPINGLVAADILVKYFGWNPYITYPSFIVGDYLWQIRGKLFEFASDKIFQPAFRGFTRFYWENIAHYQNWELAGELVERRWFTLANKYIFTPLSKIFNFAKPFLQNLFNPGFFLGMQFLGAQFMAMGLPFGWAQLAGALTGAGLWWGTHAIYRALAGSGAKTLAQWSASGWLGYFVGWGLQGLLGLLGVHGAWMQFLPLAGSLFSTVGIALFPGLGSLFSGLLINIGYFASQAAWALGISSTAYAAGLAVAVTAISVAAVAGLTIFAGFVIYSSFWVPLVEQSQAGPQSTNFSINTGCSLLPNNNYQCCSSFDITQPLLNLDNYLAHSFDLSASSLVVDLSDPAKTTDAFRRLPGEPQLSLNYIAYPSPLNVTDYTVSTTVSFNIPYYSKVDSLLSVPSDQQADLFTFINQDPRLYQTLLQPFVELLQKATPDILESPNPKYYFKEIDAQLKLFNAQKKYLDSLIGKIKTAADSTNIDVIIAELNKAKNINVTNPLDNPTDIPCASDDSRCLEYKQNLQDYYDSWGNFLGRYSVENYLNQAKAIKNLPETDPNRTKQLISLKEILATLRGQLVEAIDILDQQINLIDQIKDIIDKIYNNLSNEEANFILSLNPYNLANLSLEDKTQLEKILRANFGKAFSGNYFYIPQGTNYKVCLEAEFRGQAGQPQTVCSTISARQNFWAQTNFAKSCTTFTPK